MSKKVSVGSSNEKVLEKINEKKLAKPITITVPGELHRDIKKYKNLKISTICQEALREAISEERKNKSDMNEVTLGVERLMKQMGEGPKTTVEDFEKDCGEAGKRWASQVAEIEELKEVFENRDASALMEHFYDECCDVPREIMKEDEGDNQLFFSFYDGAKEMWCSMKDVLEEKGYEI